jgi:O-succinylbenzoic acid--CoA ligase
MMDIDHAATVIFTSGTTSKPKGVMHSYGNHYFNALGSNKNIRVLSGDRWLLSLPLYHVGGLAILSRVMLGGGAVVVSSGESQLNHTIERYQITHLSLVPSQLRHLLQTNLTNASAEWLKAILVGGQAVPDKLISEAVNRGWPIFTTYGLTEMASQVTTSASDDSAVRLSSSGRLLPYRQLQIADDGEILVRGETLFQRYLGTADPDQQLDSDGWFHTGDTGTLDEDSYLNVTGRKDNMFVSGGENIHPEEIEKCLAGIPEVLEVLVLPISDMEFGCRPVAFLKLRSGTPANCAEIIAYSKKHLPGFKVPVRFVHWPDFDSAGEMKADRRRFRGLLEAGDVVEIN